MTSELFVVLLYTCANLYNIFTTDIEYVCIYSKTNVRSFSTYSGAIKGKGKVVPVLN
jgi:hypothetical protein